MSFVATRPSASAPSDGSRTITLLDSQPEEGRSGSSGEDDVGTLRLHGAPRTRERNRPRVVWREDVVDNEGAGKKSSKICCIYNKPKKFDESSSESSSDSDSESDSACGHNHSHRHDARSERPQRSNPAPDGEGSTRSRDSATVVHELHDPNNEVNRYERIPKRKGKKPMNKGECEWHSVIPRTPL